MTKGWDELTQDEKLEHLRKDLIKAMEVVNAWAQAQQQLRHDLKAQDQTTLNQLTGVGVALKGIEQRISQMERQVARSRD
jgi:hypothetical protein